MSVLAWVLSLFRPTPAPRGPLVRAARLAGIPPKGHPEEGAALELLVVTAEQFLRANGTLTLADFATLAPEERAALLVAAERVNADRAAARGLASQSPLAAACVLAPADGGAARTRVILEQALDRVQIGRRG